MFGKTIRNLPTLLRESRDEHRCACSWASWAPNEDLQHAAKAPGLSNPFVANHRRARENGGEKKGKVEDGRNLLWWGRFDDQRARKAGGWRPCMQSHASISGRFVDTVVRTCRLSGQLQEKSFSSKNLSFETSEAWRGGQSDIIEHCWKQTKFSHWGFRPSWTPIWKRNSERVRKESTRFRGFVQQRAQLSFLRWLRATDDCPKTFWGFRRRARSLQSTPPLWQLHQSRMKSTCLLCSLQRMHLDETHFECPTSDESGPTAMSAKSAFQILTGLTVQQRAKTFFGGTLGETFEAFAIESDLRLSRCKDRERLLKICNNRQSSQFVCGAVCAECVATCNVHVHDGWSKLNLNFTRSRESFATARSENRFWGEKLSPWSGQSAG